MSSQISHGEFLFDIDEEGYFAGQCYEGALGVILKVRMRDSGWRALKFASAAGRFRSGESFHSYVDGR